MNFGHHIYMDYSDTRGKRAFLNTRMSCARREVFNGSLSVGPSVVVSEEMWKRETLCGLW